MTNGPATTSKAPPTSHALARRLLDLPDLPLIAQNDCVRFRLVTVAVDDDACWGDPEGWVEGQRAVVIADHTDAPWWDDEDGNVPRTDSTS